MKRKLKKATTAIIPIGSIEQHGPHLPLLTDAILAEKIALEAARKTDSIVTPTVSFGFSPEHMSFPGTISVSPETFFGLIRDIAESLDTHGFSKLILVNAHGGNTGLLTTLVQQLRRKLNARIKLVGVWELALEAYNKVREGMPVSIFHAEEFETSLMLALDEDMVRKNKIKRHKLHPKLTRATNGSFPGWKAEDYSSAGVLGDPTKASAKKGQYIFENAVANLVRIIREE